MTRTHAASPATGKSESLRHVLVVISPFERDNLLAGNFAALHQLPRAKTHMHYSNGPRDPEWEHVLRRTRPEILMVGWSAPVPPEGYFDESDCPVRYVCFFTGSVRRIVPRSFIMRGGLVSNWGDDVAPTVAEHALLLVLAALRRLPEWQPFLNLPAARQLAHPMGLLTRTLFNRTVCVHGFGRIARQLIRLLAPFGVRVRVYSNGVPPEYIRAHGAEPMATLAELFDGAGILIECEALTPATQGSVDERMIRLLAPGAVFVNVGRGLVVEEAALIRRASAGDIFLALDVLEVEPLPATSPLRCLPNVIISPHIGGPTHDRLPNLGARALANLNLYLLGQIPQDLITPEIYDRST